MKRLLFIVISVSLLSCNSDESNQRPVEDPIWTQEESIKMHSTFASEEEEEIENFLDHRPDWRTTKTGSGLRYFVYSKSEFSDTAKIGDLVTLDFVISLLDGTPCYDSKTGGPESFIVEKSDLESGLHEGVQYLCTADKAKIILPSHMAHGMIGDTEKIPPLTPVVYDITVVEIDKSIE
jgi:FKBP-type peptidyl-prolyl cis-trans isomerase